MDAGSIASADLASAQRAWCCGRKLTGTFGDAGLEIKAIILVLWLAALAIVIVWLRGLIVADGRTGPRVAWLKGWQGGAPMLAAAAVVYLGMNNFVSIYAYPPAPIAAYAPGWAEMSLVMWSGLLTGALAILARASLRASMA